MKVGLDDGAAVVAAWAYATIANLVALGAVLWAIRLLRSR